jgi:hypothetical protein
VVLTREVADRARREDTEVACGEVGAFVRWRAAGVAGLGFVALFGEEVVRARELVRVVVRLVVFASDISVVRVDADKVRSRTLPPGTDKVVDDAWFTGLGRVERREGHLLMGLLRAWDGEGGVVLFSVACPLFPTAGFAGSAAAQHDFSSNTLVGMTQRTTSHVRQIIRKHVSYGRHDSAAPESSSRIDALSNWSITL